MKLYNYVINLLAVVLLCSGCHSIDRMLGNKVPENEPEIQLIGGPVAGPVPVFNLPDYPGYKTVIFHGLLPQNAQITLQEGQGAVFYVFVKDVGQWFALTHNYSGAYWYQYDPVSNIVTYRGIKNPNMEYCIYEFIPPAEGLY